VASNDLYLQGREPIMGRGIAGELSPLPSGVKDAPFKLVQCKLINLPSRSLEWGASEMNESTVRIGSLL